MILYLVNAKKKLFYVVLGKYESAPILTRCIKEGR